MGNHPRKADGRRVFSAEFKRTTVQRILTGEKTVAELSRELDIVPSVIRTWARRSEAGAATAVAANEDVVPASQLREAYSRIRELERLLGRKQMEIEILEAARDVGKKVRGCAKGPGVRSVLLPRPGRDHNPRPHALGERHHCLCGYGRQDCDAGQSQTARPHPLSTEVAHPDAGGGGRGARDYADPVVLGGDVLEVLL